MSDTTIKTIKIETFNNFGTVNFVSEKNEIQKMTSAPSAVVSNVPKANDSVKEEIKEEKKEVNKEEDGRKEHLINRLSLQPKHLEKLKEWTGMNDFKVIYFNDKDLFTAKEFFNKVKGLERIMLLCETNNNMLFGGYFSKMPDKQNDWISEDSKHFIFTLRNPHLVPPTMIQPRVDNHNIIMIKGNEEITEVCENYAFVICNNTTSKQHIRFASMYHDTTYKGERLFAGNQKTFQIRNFAAIQWE
ncbi:hypothetical protein EDI_060610 [Entamoeba dispar SAW760]|uniref:TLDc domain-containing protein n=1 Tax=Entamoeba dispar (strain ATCC PRA-260 / SAW760) TaxID=370354 RepID=B0E744_ENTDS|nr:uncharacterized protein EDI_060610 [Entamoeba dispar SAW760]EDR29655.1 hypothetical protein EDI_060610 [Entamoeba dispar SAW760]|eukprot:EDR29655.1 hypothetical protein EDI_060610 [Entamoeba dispar SAW760]